MFSASQSFPRTLTTAADYNSRPPPAPGKLLVRDGREWCADIFDKFVTADQSVGVGETLLRRYTPARTDQSNIVLHLYCSHKEKVMVRGAGGYALIGGMVTNDH